MAQKAFKERLKQIKMSEFDAELYDRFLDGVRGQIKSLRIILDSLQVKQTTQILQAYQVSLMDISLVLRQKEKSGSGFDTRHMEILMKLN